MSLVTVTNASKKIIFDSVEKMARQADEIDKRGDLNNSDTFFSELFAREIVFNDMTSFDLEFKLQPLRTRVALDVSGIYENEKLTLGRTFFRRFIDAPNLLNSLELDTEVSKLIKSLESQISFEREDFHNKDLLEKGRASESNKKRLGFLKRVFCWGD